MNKKMFQVKKKKRPHPHQVNKVKMSDLLACYTTNCNLNVKLYKRSPVLKKSLVPNR